MKKFIATCAVAAATLLPSASAFAGGVNYQINITGFVPTICRVQSNVTTVSSGAQTDLGNVAQFCNDPHGYQLWVDYNPGVSGAYISVGGKLVPLSSTGSTMIAASDTAASISQQMTLINSSGQVSSLSMRMVPL